MTPRPAPGSSVDTDDEQLVSGPDEPWISNRPELVPPGYLLTTRSLALPYVDDIDGCTEREHTHPEHVLFWPEYATATVEVGGARRSLSVGQGVWVPAGTIHRAARTPETTLAATFVRADTDLAFADTVTAVIVNAATRELLDHLAYAHMPRAQRLRAQRVCLELVVPEHRPTLSLPLPKDPRIAHIARSILRDPADDRSVERWAEQTAQSARTITRAFRADTAMTFSQWRTHARLALAIRLLGEGMAVGAVAGQVGYASNSAFTAAFQRVVHCTPQQYRSRTGMS